MSCPRITDEFRSQYAALTSGAGWCDLSDRTQLELTGHDRARFLHNLCTNDILRLVPGKGCEAFFTSVQGKTIGLAYVFCCSDSLVVDTVPGQGPFLCQHLERYLIREDVQLHDRSETWRELLLAGAEANMRLNELGISPPADRMDHLAVDWNGGPVWLRRVDLAGSGSLVLSGPAEKIQAVDERIASAGFRACGRDAVEAVRIEAGSPSFTRDVTAENLPQEVGRDDRAISFTKGCYLGQETVARIDALGHVNRRLVGLRFSGDQLPEPGTELFVDEKAVGRVTSSAFSLRLLAPIALGYVRRGYWQEGSRFQSGAGESGEAQVVPLPMTGN